MHDKTPFYGTADGLGIFEELIKEAINTIGESNNPRIIVIQTWLTIDFCIRETLITGLGLQKFIHEDLDLRYLLRIGFNTSIKLIKKLERIQEKLPKRIAVPYKMCSMEFLLFLKKKDPSLYKKLLEAEQDYHKEHHPSWVNKLGSFFINLPINLRTGKVIKYREVDDEWLEVVKKLDKSWIKKAEKLNELRNNAAHFYSPEKIYTELDIKGENKINHLKQYCKDLLNTLLDI